MTHKVAHAWFCSENYPMFGQERACDCGAAKAQDAIDNLTCVLDKVRAAVSNLGGHVVNAADGQQLLDSVSSALEGLA